MKPSGTNRDLLRIASQIRKKKEGFFFYVGRFGQPTDFQWQRVMGFTSRGKGRPVCEPGLVSWQG